METKDIDIEKYLSKFKVYIPETLFPPVWANLKMKMCPICGNKLYLPMKNKKIVYCKSKKHAKPFIIGYEAFMKLTK